MAAARFLSQRLRELASAVGRISETGRPGPVMELQRQDEFGMLTRAFQSMLNRLAESYAVLEQRVDERTQALLTSESKLAGILASLLDGVWSLSPDGKRVTYISPSSAGVTGLVPEVLQNDLGAFFAAVHPDDLMSVRDAMRRMVEHGESIDLEFRFEHPIKGLRVLQARAHTVFDDDRRYSSRRHPDRCHPAQRGRVGSQTFRPRGRLGFRTSLCRRLSDAGFTPMRSRQALRSKACQTTW